MTEQIIFISEVKTGLVVLTLNRHLGHSYPMVDSSNGNAGKTNRGETKAPFGTTVLVDNEDHLCHVKLTLATQH